MQKHNVLYTVGALALLSVLCVVDTAESNVSIILAIFGMVCGLAGTYCDPDRREPGKSHEQ